MAKKSARKLSDDEAQSEAVNAEMTVESEDAVVTAPEESAPAKSKSRATEDSVANGSVSLADIRKSVAFVNSVGGLDKALGLLQILKVAREVQ